jgi:hypothetical protein
MSADDLRGAVRAIPASTALRLLQGGVQGLLGAK